MRIQLPSGVSGSENLPKTRKLLKNCFNNLQNAILSRPGINLLNTTGKVARGQFVWNDSLYQVVSTDLIQITNTTTGAFTTIGAGAIAGPQPIETAFGFNDAVIVVPGGAIYTVSKTNVITNISGNANFVPCRSVVHIDSRFVYIPDNGDPAFFSDVGAAGTVQALSFFDAEQLPDKNLKAFVLKNLLYIAGEESIQVFRNTGAFPNPFVRINATIDNGYIGGLLEHDNTFMFIGRKRNQSPGIFAIGQGRAAKISNEYIDLILSTYTPLELSQAVSSRVVWRGHDIALFTLRRDSFGFYGGQWFLTDTVEDGVSRPWQGGYISQFEGEYYTAFSGNIGKISNITKDYGERVTRVMEIGFEQKDNRRFTCQSIELGISQGYNSVDGSVALLMSRDNVLYGQPFYQNTKKIGGYSPPMVWNAPGGLGRYDGFMGLRFYTTEDIQFSVDSLVLNFREQ